LTQTKQEVEGKLIVRFTDEITSVRRDSNRERNNLKEENKKSKEKLLSLETQLEGDGRESR